MKRQIKLTPILLLATLWFAITSHANSDPSADLPSSPSESKYVQAAKEFQVDGVRLGMTPDEFRRRFPSLRRYDDLSDAKTGSIGIRVDSTARTDGIDAVFWNGKLIAYYVWYFPSRTNAMGGWEVLVERLVERLGKAEADSRGARRVDGEARGHLYWKFDEANFYLSFSVTDRRVLINVTDTKAWTERRDQRREVADPGF